MTERSQHRRGGVSVNSLPLIKEIIRDVSCGYSVQILTSGGYSVSVEALFHYPNSSRQISPDAQGCLSIDAKELVGKTILSAGFTDEGELRIEFAGGGALTVLPDADHEAWQVSDSSGTLAVVMPGGDVALWDRE